MSTEHPGFKSVASGMAAKQGISKQEAGDELASSTRKAVANGAAKKNPKLLRVKMKRKM